MNNSNLKKRYPLNVEGDFYVEDEMCICCGAPEMEAPELMSMDYAEEGLHCYFKKQPTNQEQVQQAINAITASCCAALRYSGNNPIILNKLVQLGERNQCDIFNK